MNKFRPFIAIAIILAVLAVAGFFLVRARRNQQVFSDSMVSLPTVSSSPSTTPRRASDAVVTLEEFGDYQCPPCGQLHPTLKSLKQEYGPNLNFVFRNLPLTAIHKNALVAAQAAEAARVQNKFWEMHDLLYESQEVWKDDINPRSIFVKFASDLGLDTARFSRDMQDKQIQLRIQADQDAATQLGVIGTPTVLIDGHQLLPEKTTPDGLRKGIETMLSRKSS
ncbi:MAG TPA: thioredoxin domain-containing protein [Pyrinomonadaceae bacterium]|nr:thioredoxin domain-containing protein [Pyrinomonadaceae bacterium]